MEFGHLSAGLQDVDFTLPAVAPMTTATLLADKDDTELEVYVGCAKWGQQKWLGSLYPRKTKEADFLALYTQQFNTIEFAATFYQIYKPEQMQKWGSMATFSPGFKFCPRFPQKITHIRRLINAEEATAEFYASIKEFGEHLGPCLLQLPDNISYKSFEDLKAYLKSLPKHVQVFLELRNEKWSTDRPKREELFEVLQTNNIGASIIDSAGRRDCVHMNLTTPHAYIRFVGNDLDSTDYKRMDDWIARLFEWKEQGLKSLYFIVHQLDDATAPATCAYMIEQLNDKLGLTLKSPDLSPK